MFHWKDGWLFGRGRDGSVHIRRRGPDGISIEIEIDSSSWCSIIAAVSPSGDTAEMFSAADTLHTGRRHDRPVNLGGVVPDLQATTPMAPPLPQSEQQF